MEGLDERALGTRLWRWLDKKANRRTGVVASMDLLQVEDEGATWVFGVRSRQHRLMVRDAIWNLVDRDVLEVVDEGGPSRLKVLVKPPQEKISVEDCHTQRGAAAGGVILARSAGVTTTLRRSEVRRDEVPDDRAEAKDRDVDPVRQSQRSAFFSIPRPPRSQAVILAQDVFPQLLTEHRVGISMPQGDWPILARNLKLWYEKHQISYDTIRLMMDEFVKHPEWCRRSKGAPWKVFLSRRSEILALMRAEHQSDPSNRRIPKDQGYWVTRHTSRAISMA